jgi:carnitine-CoA ligase
VKRSEGWRHVTEPGQHEETFAECWRRSVAIDATRTFLVWEGSDGNVRGWTYRQFGQLVDEVAGYLGARGTRSGGRVHVALTNSPAFIAAWLACAQFGAVLVSSDPAATSRELAECFSRTSPVAGIGSRRRPADYQMAAAACSMKVVLVDEDDTDLDSIRAEPWRGQGGEQPPEPAQPLAIMFTSGTTSRPKGVVVTQANYAFTGRVMAAAAGWAVTTDSSWYCRCSMRTRNITRSRRPFASAPASRCCTRSPRPGSSGRPRLTGRPTPAYSRHRSG